VRALLTSAERYLAVMLKLGPDLLTHRDRGGGRSDDTNGCLLRTAERVRPGLQLSNRKNVIAGIETGSLFSDLNIGVEGGRWSAKLANRSRAPLSTWFTRSQVSSETRAKSHRWRQTPVIPRGNFGRRGQANWGDRSKSKKRSSDRRAPYKDKKHKADS
jgi:hypothetical protein